MIHPIWTDTTQKSSDKSILLGRYCFICSRPCTMTASTQPDCSRPNSSGHASNRDDSEQTHAEIQNLIPVESFVERFVVERREGPLRRPLRRPLPRPLRKPLRKPLGRPLGRPLRRPPLEVGQGRLDSKFTLLWW